METLSHVDEWGRLENRSSTYTDNNRLVPANLKEIERCLVEKRPSLDPPHFTNEHFEKIKHACDNAEFQEEVSQKIVPKIIGESSDYHTLSRSILNNTPTPDHPLCQPKSADIYDGVNPSWIDERVLDRLCKTIIPDKSFFDPIAPNFFVEVKRDVGCLDEATREIRYDGYIGANAMHTLQNLDVTKSIYDKNAYTFSCIYLCSDHSLRIYATFAKQSNSFGDVEYYSTKLGTYFTTDTMDEFRKAATAVRNIRDLAARYRTSFINKANGIVRRPDEMLKVFAGLSPPSSTRPSVIASRLAPYESLPNVSESTLRTMETEKSLESDCADTFEQGRLAPYIAPKEVTTDKAMFRGNPGRLFETEGHVVFVADEEWDDRTLEGKPALFNSKYHVWCVNQREISMVRCSYFKTDR